MPCLLKVRKKNGTSWATKTAKKLFLKMFNELALELKVERCYPAQGTVLIFTIPK